MHGGFENMRRLDARGPASRRVVVDAKGAMLGPDCVLVRRTTAGYCSVRPEEAAAIQRLLCRAESEDPDRLFALSRGIADALNGGELALAQIYGDPIPVAELDSRQLKQLAAAARSSRRISIRISRATTMAAGPIEMAVRRRRSRSRRPSPPLQQLQPKPPPRSLARWAAPHSPALPISLPASPLPPPSSASCSCQPTAIWSVKARCPIGPISAIVTIRTPAPSRSIARPIAGASLLCSSGHIGADSLFYGRDGEIIGRGASAAPPPSIPQPAGFAGANRRRRTGRSSERERSAATLP